MTKIFLYTLLNQQLFCVVLNYSPPFCLSLSIPQKLLCRTVTVVFHSAATVKFDEKLKLSVTINMLGTKRLVELCHRMKSLDVSVETIRIVSSHIRIFTIMFVSQQHTHTGLNSRIDSVLQLRSDGNQRSGLHNALPSGRHYFAHQLVARGHAG